MAESEWLPGGVELHHEEGAASEVPQTVNEIRSFLTEPDDPDERARRAALVESVEASRDGGPRSTVTDAVAAARQTTDTGS